MITLDFTDGSHVPAATVYGVARNIVAHAHELNNNVPTEPVVFLMAQTSLRGLESVPMPWGDPVHHEAELVLVLGEDAPLGAKPTWESVAGVTVGLDLTHRPNQRACIGEGLPWTSAKSFAGSAIVAPFIPLTDVGDPTALHFSLSVNDAPRQEGRATDLLFDVPAILAHLAGLAPLQRGDVVFTGTPPGVADMTAGDRFRLRLMNPDRVWSFDGVL